MKPTADKSAIQRLLEASGLSGRRFARIVLAARGERTWRRWTSDQEFPPELEEWAAKDVVRIERRGNMLHLTLFAPEDPSDDRRAAGADES